MLNSEKTWRILMKSGNKNYSERIEKDNVEINFWKKFISDKKTIEDKYAKEIKKVIIPELKKIEIKSALEIGPGWGNYTFDIANEVSSLSCLDISPDILDFILEKAKIKNINNICTINSKLETAELDNYDFIFAYNCFYRIKEIEKALRKIIGNSKKLAIIGMNSNLDREPTLEINKKLGINIKRHLLNHNVLYNLLNEMMIDNIKNKEIILDRSYEFESIQSVFNFEKNFILDKLTPHQENEIKKILFKYYEYKNGKYIYTHKIKAGLIFIKTFNRKEA